MLKLLKRVVNLTLCLVIGLTAYSVWLNKKLPDTFMVPRGQALALAQLPWLQPLKMEGSTAAQTVQPGSSYNVTLSLFGKIPVKTVRAVAVDRRAVTVCGIPFGIKMFSEGAMVVGFTDIYTESGYQNPAKKAGLCMGDSILRMDSLSTHGNEDVSLAIRGSKGRTIQVEFLRSGKVHTTQLQPVQDSSHKRWQAGMWVRDSSAGIGTLTFVDNAKGVYGGLGHPISDSDTGQCVNLREGEIAPVTIKDCKPGQAGAPGELKGRFMLAPPMGDITVNDETGVYGHIQVLMKGQDMPVAQAQEVCRGAAKIYTTIDGNTPRWYRVQIEKLSLGENDPNRNMILRVDDPALLAKTGGIVQGMSGSPIVQNGHLVGAVTHVFVNDPTRGYGIFAENMLKTADRAQRKAA